MRHRLEFIGWLLFGLSAVGFTIESWLSRSWWALAASVLFLVGVIAFLIPAPRTVPSTDSVLAAALPEDPLPPFDGRLTEAAEPGRPPASPWWDDGTPPGAVDGSSRPTPTTNGPGSW